MRPVRAVCDTPLSPGDALMGIVAPPKTPGRTFEPPHGRDVVYRDADGVTTHVRIEDPRERLSGFVEGPFGRMTFEVHASSDTSSGWTRLRVDGAYEPEGFLPRLMQRRSARMLEAQLYEGLASLLRARERERAERPEPAKAPGKVPTAS